MNPTNTPEALSRPSIFKRRNLGDGLWIDNAVINDLTPADIASRGPNEQALIVYCLSQTAANTVFERLRAGELIPDFESTEEAVSDEALCAQVMHYVRIIETSGNPRILADEDFGS